MLFLAKLPFLHTKVKHSVFVTINKFVSYQLRLEVVANTAVNILPKPTNKNTSTFQKKIIGKAHMRQIQHI